MKKYLSNMIVDIVLAVILLAVGIVLLPPVTNLGQTILNIFVAIGLVLYLVFFLFDRMMKDRGTLRILTMVEFALIVLVAIGLVFKQFNVLNLGSTCQILGFVIWLRGVNGSFRGYIVSSGTAKRKFTMLMFALSVVMVSFGAYIFAKPPFSDKTVIYILAIAFIVAAIALLIFALAYAKRPARRSKSSSKS
jgi:hypothetical protein